jgi:hypothetical protein
MPGEAEENHKHPVWISSNMVEIQTRFLLDGSLEYYHNTNLFGPWSGMSEKFCYFGSELDSGFFQAS